MKNLNIISDKKASLRKKSSEIKFPLEPYIKDLGFKMREHLINSQDSAYLEKHPKVRPGVGLAAPQIGKNIRMFAVYFPLSEEITFDYILINPVITKKSKQLSYLSGGEGCLSVLDEHQGYVYRNAQITLEAYDLIRGEKITLELNYYPAIVFQHEYDHLNGILFYDLIDKDDPFKVIEDAIIIE